MEVNLISTFAEFKELKNIDRPTMMSVLEDIFRTSTRETSRSGETERWWRKWRIPTLRYRSRRFTR